MENKNIFVSGTLKTFEDFEDGTEKCTEAGPDFTGKPDLGCSSGLDVTAD